ncbi:hypothetical protein ACSBR2_002595 [Camellia fascicularis]
MLWTITNVQESKAKDDHFCLLEDNVTGLVGVINLSFHLKKPVIDQNLFYAGMKYTIATFATAMCNIVPAMFFLMAWILRNAGSYIWAPADDELIFLYLIMHFSFLQLQRSMIWKDGFLHPALTENLFPVQTALTISPGD